MTDRYHSLTVTLDVDIREDDAQAIISAIKQMRRVIDVTGNVADLDSHMAEQRTRRELGQKIIDVIYGNKP